MQAGELDRRITLKRASITRAPSGAEVKTWSTLKSLWASRRRASARETLASAEIAAAVTDVFEVRWGSAWADLSPTDRLVFEGRTYDIASVDEIGRREGLRINAVARAE